MSATTSMATHTTAPDSVPPLPANGPSGVGAKGLVPPPPDADFGARLTPTKQAAATPPAKRGSDLALLRQVSTKPTMSVSPFVGSWSKITGLNLARTIVLSPLGVVRLSASVLIVLACTFWCWLVLLGRQPEDQLGTVRRRLAVPVVQVGARLLLLTLGFWWIPVKGERDLGARVLVANHSTLVDVLVLLWQVGPSFLSKQSVLDAPLFGTICKALQVVGVDRVSNEDKGRSKALMTRLIQDRSGPPLLIFPEGTTTRCDTMIRFKPGAFALGAPVQPILLHWRYGLFDPANTALTPPLPWLLQMLTQVYQTVSLELLPAVHPDETEVGNPLMFAANVRAKMLAVLERRAPYPMYDCEQGVDDFLVWKRFVERKVPDPRAALHSLSLQGLRAAVSLATPAPRQAVSLAMLLACANRYMKLLRASGAAPARLASLDVLARWALGAHQTAGPSPAERAFESAFAHAMAFPTTADDSSIDLRAFAMGACVRRAGGQTGGAADARAQA
jgi:1-acyl-sn-glycerol-3-phosphate acyltransferase